MLTSTVDRRICAPRWPGRLAGLIALLILVAAPAAARQTGAVEGTIRAAGSGEPLAGVAVTVVGSGHTAVSDFRGRFNLAALPAGQHTLVAERIGYDSVRRAVVVPAGGSAQFDFELATQALAIPDIVVSVDREARRRAETPATVNVVGSDAIQTAHATHPSELLGRVPGVWVNSAGGEGHMAAIRQPLSTNPVYLYLEDGVPTRSTGFFNHNALYEVNLPQADRVEVIKGPATALYGSDAIGATIDVGTRAPSPVPTLGATLEGGAFGWGRLLLDGSGTVGGNGLRADLNLTRTDGWRDRSAYDRQAATLRWDRALGAATSLKTVAAFSHINQQSAGSIARDDYQDRPTLNYIPISFRTVKALRLSSELRHVRAQSLFTLTAFARDNDMELIPSWALSYDPTIYSTGHRSLGLMARYRRDFAPLRTRLVAGVDIDRSPGYRLEKVIQTTRVGKVFTDYAVGDAIYDYDVTFQGASPYLQAEFAPAERFRLSAGVRYDHLGYDYRSRLAPLATGAHRRPADTRVSYDHLSPKLGATYEFAPELNLFAAYSHGFRAPAEGQLFRQGRAVNTLALDPVKVDSYEGGLRGQLGARVRYEVSAYRMVKEDDILSYSRPDGAQETTNAGRTLHRGVEMGLTVALLEALKLDLGYSHARHGYELWQPAAGVDFGGKEMEQAPRDLANAILAYAPRVLGGGYVALETSRIGGYWMDAANTTRYEGHTLLTLRGDLPVHRRITVFGRLANLTNARYAESATYTVARGEELTPGMPRTLNIGIQYR